uniref:DNA-directed RNA polymerase III subunit RPC5 n=1 Tax=Rhabditophanes sp. KR3021 TaxID=114890 RepID=A0AC35TIX7_9BILA
MDEESELRTTIVNIENAYLFDNYNEVNSLDYSAVDFEVPIVLGKPVADLYRLQFNKKGVPVEKSDAKHKRKAGIFEIQLDPSDAMNVTEPKFMDPTQRKPAVYRGNKNANHSVMNHAIGYLKDGKMVLLPVEGTYEMKRIINGEETKMTAVDMSDDDRKPLNPVRVKFARAETDAQKKRKEESSFFKQKMADQESWIPMKVKNGDLNTIARKVDHITQVTKEVLKLKEIVIPMNKESKDDVKKVDIFATKLNLHLEELGMDQRIETLFLKAGVLRHSELMRLTHFVKTNMNEAIFLAKIRECAILCRGLWVISGSFLHTERHLKPPRHGKRMVASEKAALLKLRMDMHNFSLCMLQAGKRVTRSLVAKIFHVSIGDAEEILAIFAVKKDKGWKLKIDDDEVLLDNPKFSEIVRDEDHKLLKWFEKDFVKDYPGIDKALAAAYKS